MTTPITGSAISGYVIAGKPTVAIDARRFTKFERILCPLSMGGRTVPYSVPSLAMTGMFAKIFPKAETVAADSASDRWKPQINSARITWGKLSSGELVSCEGDERKLASLLQKRYGISPEQAELQVKLFFDRLNA